MEDFSWENTPRSQIMLSKQSNIQDLAGNTSVTPNEYGGIYDKPKKPKISFLQSRLNKDNFWNVMFFVGINFGFGIASLIISLTNNNTFFSIVMWIVILTVPYIIKRNSSITFDKEKLQFLNRNNEVLNDRAPNFFLLVVLTGGLTALTGLVLDGAKGSINNSIAFSIFAIMPTLIPTVYCILKNFPIAVYFKKEAYIGDGTARSYSSSETSRTAARNTHSTLSLARLRNSPINSWHNTNIYNRNR